MNDLQRTDRRVAVVTGAGSGIGRATALEFARRGWALALLGRRDDPLRRTAEAAGAPTLVLPVDVTRPADVDTVFQQIGEEFGRIDVLFNNAGSFGPSGRVDEVDFDEWARTLDVNVTGTLVCAASAFRIMREQQPGGGRIINNGSVSARRPRPRSVAYTASKHAVTGITRSIALDGRPFGITATQIDIGNAETELLSGIGAGTGAAQPDGSFRAEPVFPPEHAARMVVDVAELPASTAVHELVITATGMPYDGRG